MNKWAAFVLIFGFSVCLYAKPKELTEQEQQARLFHFDPAKEKPIDASLPEREFLQNIAKDTWGYFHDVADKETGLPLDNIVISSTYNKVNSYTSTTNVGLYLMSLVSGTDLGFMTREEAIRRVQLALNSLKKIDTWQGQPFNYYETIGLTHNDSFVSSVDNGWLAAGLIVARQAFLEELAGEIDPLLDQLDFSKLYDPEVGQLYLGYDAKKKQYSPYHYGLFCTEPRVASYIGIAKADLPKEHWYKIFRTIPPEWDWQQQKPRGKNKIYSGHKVFSGYYTYEGMKFVPSWGGSLFEFLMPTLVLDEQGLAEKGLGRNNQLAVQSHVDYALNDKKYPVWGMSPCSIPDQPEGYKEYGVKYLGTKGYEDGGVITPHVTFLALAVDPKAAVKNLRNLLSFKGIYGEYGFHDSVNVKTGVVSPRYLSLDQAMSFIALNNYLNDGAIRKRFHSYKPIQETENLLKSEQFF